MKQKLVVIGNGMAGMRTVEEVLKLAHDRYEICVFGAEPHGNYNRIMLSPVLAGEMAFRDIVTHDLAWYQQNGIRLHSGPGKLVTQIHRAEQRVVSQDGSEEFYDRLLIATGSNPFIPPAEGNHLNGIIAFRKIEDVENMLKVAKNRRHALVIGGGLLGLEAANGLLMQGMHVTVLHSNRLLLNRQLDEPASELLQATLTRKGLHFKMQATATQFHGDNEGHVTAVTLSDNTSLPADLVVMAVGIRPNIRLAQEAGVYCEKGIVVNDHLQTYDPKIYAVGECVQHRGDLFGLVAPLWEQAKVAAHHLAETGLGIYHTPVLSTKLKVTGINLFSMGDFMGGPETESILYTDPCKGIYKKIILQNDRVIGAVMYGDTRDGAWFTELMDKQANTGAFREFLVFGKDLASQAGFSPV